LVDLWLWLRATKWPGKGTVVFLLHSEHGFGKVVGRAAGESRSASRPWEQANEAGDGSGERVSRAWLDMCRDSALNGGMSSIASGKNGAAGRGVEGLKRDLKVIVTCSPETGVALCQASGVGRPQNPASMPHKRCSEEQIIYALRSVDTGAKIGDVCASSVSPSRRIIVGRSSMMDSASASCGASSS